MCTMQLHKAGFYCMYVHVCGTAVCMETTGQIFSSFSCKKEGMGGGTVLDMYTMTVTVMKWRARPHHQCSSMQPVRATIGRCTHLRDVNPSNRSDLCLGEGARGNPVELMVYSASSSFEKGERRYERVIP